MGAGESVPDSLSSCNNLAGAHRAAGDLGRAIPLCEQTLADCERVLGAEHPTPRAVRGNVLPACRQAHTDPAQRDVP
uniref:tetratricopeptide repeat protein n=1 Tax=Herbidospora sakaeratensis TaxID=564415 RepID=UPI0009FC97B4